MLLSLPVLLAASNIALVSAVQNVRVAGNEFVNNVTSNRFQMLGVAYQPGGSQAFGQGSDPLSNGTICLRDAALMQPLGVNTIRVYNLDPLLNHDACMSIFNSVGIYLVLDVNSPLPNESLDPGNLESSYSAAYLNRVFQVIEAFHNYPNVLGFFSANEVINKVSHGQKVPNYLRAVTRDINSYIAKHSPRKIPVGYSAADVREVLVDTWAYISCAIDGNQQDPSRNLFYAINSYSWCGPTGPGANYQASGYDVIIKDFGQTSIPIFFSEFGCNKVQPRVWDEIAVIYGNMTSVMSGGLVYEYTQESNDYGLVNLYQNGSAGIRVDYDNLQKAYAKLDFKSLQSQNSSGTNIRAPTCGSDLITGSAGFTTNFDLPNVPDGAQELIDNGAKNAKQGKLISVTQTNVPVPVYASDGTRLNNLAIKPLADDQSNTPSTTSSGAKPSSSKKNASNRVNIWSSWRLACASTVLVISAWVAV